MTDEWYVIAAVTLAAAFGFLSFLNTLGMHLAIRELKKRAIHIMNRVERAMDDPTAAIAPHVIKFIERLNDDKKLRGHVIGALIFGVNTMKNAVTGKETVVDKDGKVIEKKKPGGIVGQIQGILEFAQGIGILKAPKA